MQKLQTVNAETLLYEPLEKPSFVVDSLIPTGLSLFCGSQKIGKSWLMLKLCLCVSQGMQLAATKDTDRLFSMLPYKTLAFSKIEGRHGTYALIDKGENRDRKIRKPRPSIRAQLKADKAKTAPKKAAAKTKNHDMEV
ncbi:AAA family ATPase [Ventrimonas faecis]|uniref:AAA family ATPase n=1 Tax=Ventrimonas faecis TaxID=3133170 RepID=UPI003F490BFB